MIYNLCRKRSHRICEQRPKHNKAGQRK
uniref:Uncharacterized protein n=1 Tax=Rhizophora mucronata TaxID=61149 RepID=A0A2P2PK67_RHIMU